LFHWDFKFLDNMVDLLLYPFFPYIIQLRLYMTYENYLCPITITSPNKDHIAGVIACVLAAIAVDRGFKLRSGQIKDFKIGICCFSASIHIKELKTCWLGSRIMCPCLAADCCFSELALYKNPTACWSSTKRMQLVLAMIYVGFFFNAQTAITHSSNTILTRFLLIYC
jgi:hypothetical protein